MRDQAVALLKVVVVLAVGVAIFVLATRFVSPWLVAGLYAAALAGGLWVRSRRVCCYLCRGSLESGSGVYWIDRRRRLICRTCERINGLPLSGKAPSRDWEAGT